VGRGEESGRLDALLADAADGRPQVVALRGDPGIGKTHLLEHVCGTAAGFRVVRMQGHEAERDIPFAALSMLVGPLLGGLPGLPAAQVSALEGALNLGPAVTGDRLAVGAATLGVLAAAAEQGPLLVAVDDVHLFDLPSLQTLFFAMRRMHAERVAVIMTARPEADVPPVVEQWLEPIRQIELRGLDLADARALTAGRGTLPEAVWEASTGNPLALLEMTAPHNAVALDEPLQLSARLLRAYGRRLVGLPQRTRDALLLVAAAGRAGDLLDDALRHAGLTRADLEPAEDGELVVQEDGTARFPHPLVCSAVYHSASPATKRAAHRIMVTAYEGRTAPGAAERRAFHLAAATTGPDESVAEQLAASARIAAGRLSHTTAAALFDKAVRLSPPGAARTERILEAAIAGQAGGTLEVAGPLLELAIAETEDLDLRTMALHLQVRIQMWSGQPAQARDQLLDLADRTEARHPEWAGLMRSQAATVSIVLGDQPVAYRMAQRAAELTADQSDADALPVLIVQALTLAMNGEPEPAREVLRRCEPHMAGCDPLDSEQLPVLNALAYASLEEPTSARRRLEATVRETRAAQAVGLLPFQLSWLAMLCWQDGDWNNAHAHAHTAAQLAQETGWTTELPNSLLVLATVEASLGREDDARAHAAQATGLAAGQSSSGMSDARAGRVLGLLELGAGHAAQAAEHLGVAGGFALAHRMGDPVLFDWAGDLTEALARAGRTEQARTALRSAVREAERSRRPTQLAVAARGRGLLAATDEEGCAAFEDALRWHAAARRPFEEARTQLCYGEFLRRHQRRVDARKQLGEALTTFNRLGATAWARRAEAELGATGITARRRPTGEATTERLTPQELQVALVVADGATNAEAAARLFLSAKTIEFHLSNAYRKLGIRSRSALVRKVLDEGLAEVSPAPAAAPPRIPAQPSAGPPPAAPSREPSATTVALAGADGVPPGPPASVR
jgi:DNA-binding CsgD family transcriptional regulator